MSDALEATGLGKRYGRSWGLRDCSLALPRGHVAALVGPNGAGKTTLLKLAAGLLRPTTGGVRVFGAAPGRPESLPGTGYVGQETPLYLGFTVADHLEFGRRLNPGWDGEAARARLASLDLPLDRRAGDLSGGQRAQVALTMALAKRPRLLLLDEPVATLDPLARREFLSTLMGSVADQGVTVVLSSHLIADLEHRCDYLIVLSASRVQVLGEVDQLLAEHRLITGPRADAERIAGVDAVVQASHGERQTTALVRARGPIADPAWTARDVGLEELVLAYLAEPDAGTLPGPHRERPGSVA